MIHEIAVQLGAALGAKGCPLGAYVIDGPEHRNTTTFARERIVFEHDPDGGDSFEQRKQADTNPRTLLTRFVGVKITIYAQQPNKGAIYWEHKRRAEHVLDMVLCALYNIVKARQNTLKWRSGKFIFPEDLTKSETPGGAVYELLISIDRGIADRNWDGTAFPTATISPYMIGGQALTFAAAGHTITRSAGSWLGDGFKVGQSILVSGSASNNGVIGPITALTATVMTFAAGVVNEGPTLAATVTGPGPVVHTTTTAVGPDGTQETGF